MRTALTIAGSDSGRRRRHSGRSEDLCRARRLRHVRDHGRHGAEHASASPRRTVLEAGSRHRADRSGRRRHRDPTPRRSACSPPPRSSRRSSPRSRKLELPLVVADPVMLAKSGAAAARRRRRRGAACRTAAAGSSRRPNLPEAEALSGRRIQSLADARDAARRIQQMGARAVLVKGGHSSYAPSPDLIVDVLLDDDAFYEFRTPRIATTNTHGTGCTLSAAIAACLALGHPAPRRGRARHSNTSRVRSLTRWPLVTATGP